MRSTGNRVNIFSAAGLSPAMVFLLFLCFFFTSIGAGGQSLPAYLTSAAENSPSLRSAYLQYEQAVQRAAQQGFLPEPTFSFGYFIVPVETRVGPQAARFSVNQMIPWPATLGRQEEVALAQARTALQEFLNQRNELFFQVKSQFYQLYLLSRTQEALRDNLELLQNLKQVLLKRYSTANTNMANVLRVEMAMNEVQFRLDRLEREYEADEIQFNLLLNRADTIPVTISDTLSYEQLSTEEIRDSVLANNPQLQVLEARQEEAGIQRELAGLQRYPSFGVGVDYMVVREREDMDMPDNGKNPLMVMGSVTIPINRKKYTAAEQEADLRIQELQEQERDIRNNLLAQFEQSLTQVEVADERVQFLLDQVDLAETVYESLVEAFANEMADFEEVLEVEQELIDLRLQLIDAMVNRSVALARIQTLQGNDL